MHTNRKLFDLATRNSQRNATHELLSSAPESVRAVLNNADVIYHPEVSELFAPIIHRAIELHKLGDMPKVGVEALVTSSRDKAFSYFCRWATELPDDEYVCVFGGGNGVYFNNVGGWVSNLPGFGIHISSAIKLFRALSQRGIEEAAFASRNGQHALILEAHSGFLPSEPSDQESIYEVSAW